MCSSCSSSSSPKFWFGRVLRGIYEKEEQIACVRMPVANICFIMVTSGRPSAPVSAVRFFRKNLPITNSISWCADHPKYCRKLKTRRQNRIRNWNFRETDDGNNFWANHKRHQLFEFRSVSHPRSLKVQLLRAFVKIFETLIFGTTVVLFQGHCSIPQINHNGEHRHFS